MRTYVYIDGFNLYYGALKGTTYKWLNLTSLFEKLLPKNDIICIKYFTAKITARQDDPSAPHRQDAYLRALKASCPNVQTIFGHFLSHPTRMPLVNPAPSGPNTVEVIKTEEKGSDVNLAVHMVNDAWLDLYDVAVVVSNDSDLAEPMRVVRSRNKVTGLITPSSRKPSQQLSRHAVFKRPLRTGILGASQLEDSIAGTQVSKPASW